jgi:putative intracellular protease/amidase
MKRANVIFIILSLSFCVCATAQASKKVLIIVSNIVDFASPQGDNVEFSMDPLGISSYTIKYEKFLVRANSSLAPKDVKVSDYWAVYIGGGYGPLFDVANTGELQTIISKIYEAGGGGDD